MAYKPSAPFVVPMKLLKPTDSSAYGVKTKTMTDPKDADLIYGSFKTYGGTEGYKDNVYTLIDTGVIDTWYRPDIKADCQIYLCETEEIYNIIGQPEDIEFRHQYMRFKVQKVGGKA